MVDDLELVRTVFDADPIPACSSHRAAIRERLLAEIAASEAGDPFAAVQSDSASRRARRPRRSRLGIAAGAAVTVVAAGGGIAAAAGVLPLPWAPPKAVVSFMNAPDRAALPGAVVRITVPGPGSTVLQVVTDLVDNGPDHFECAALSVKGPQGHPEPVNGNGMCSPASAPPGGTTSNSQSHFIGPSIVLSTWRAPSGATFKIVWGEAPSESATVGLTDSRGVEKAAEPVSEGYYVIYLPSSSLMTYSNLTFYNSAGQVLTAVHYGGKGQPFRPDPPRH